MDYTAALALSSQARPPLLDVGNQVRAEYQMLRYAMLIDDFQDQLKEWLDETVGEEYAMVWGVPDTSLNPLSSQTRQLTTPGLYGRQPTRRGPADDESLVGPQGAMRHYWPRMQAIQYLTVGMGVWFQTVGISPSGTMIYRSVKPFDVVVWVDDEDPLQPVQIWELRLRHVLLPGATIPTPTYTWDQWSLGDQHRGGDTPPSYRVVQAGRMGKPGDDVSAQFIRAADGQLTGALEGDSYWWRHEDGTPFLPWLVHRAVDDGEFWPNWRRTLHTGTLRACTLWTFVHRSALFSTGQHTIVGGVDVEAVPGQAIHQGDGNQQAGAIPLITVPVHPGMMTYVPVGEGGNLQSIKIDAGINLPNLSNFAALYATLLANGDGLNPSDATRRSANPTSGAALAISAGSRREFSASVKPLFRETDLAAIEKSARIRTLAGLSTPSDGYTIEYHDIPLTPTEAADLRDQVDWEEGSGKIGPVEAYQRAHPGVDYDTAQAAVVNAAVESARVQALIDETLAEEGLTKQAPSPPPPTEPTEPTDPEETEPPVGDPPTSDQEE